jgi:hypothetical protein
MVAKFPIVCKNCGVVERLSANPVVDVFQREDGIDIHLTNWGARAYCRVIDFELPGFAVSIRFDKHPTVKMI